MKKENDMEGLRDVVLSNSIPKFVILALEKVGVLTRREKYVKENVEVLVKKLFDERAEEMFRNLDPRDMGQA